MSRPVLIRFQCRIWYPSRLQICDRCQQNHLTYNTYLCDAYREDLPEIEVFAKGQFSNFANCKMKMDGLLFPTSEHAYQWHACMEHINTELGEKVMNVKSSCDAKQIVAQLKGDVIGGVFAMKRVLIVKADSSKPFRDEQICSGNRLLVERSPIDIYWGSGLNYHLTQTTHPDYYPGLNKLGKLLCEVRVLLREKISSSSLPAEAMDEVATPLHQVTLTRKQII